MSCFNIKGACEVNKGSITNNRFKTIECNLRWLKLDFDLNLMQIINVLVQYITDDNKPVTRFLTSDFFTNDVS